MTIPNLPNGATDAAVTQDSILKSIASSIGLDLSSLSLSKIIAAVVVLIVLIALSKLISKLFLRTVNKTKIAEGAKIFTAKAVKFALYFISVLIFADFIGIPITSIIALFSLIGLAVSLSIQNLLGNIMSGITLLILKPFKIGDYIETDEGGNVSKIGLFYTEITTWDNKKVFIPNEKIMASKLTNFTAEPIRRVDVRFNAGYEFDIEEVKNALRDAVESVPLLLDEPKPTIGIAEYADSAVIYDVRAWTQTDDYFDARYALMEAVSESYKKHGIKMAYNRLEVDLKKNMH